MRSKTILSVVAFIAAFGFSTAFAKLFITETQIESTCVLFNHNDSENVFEYKDTLATAVKISALISQDKRNGRENDRILYLLNNGIFSPSDGLTFSDYANSVERYVDDSSSMDTSDLPSDFQTAWREHMKAWRNYSDFLNQIKQSSSRKAWKQEEFEGGDNFHSEEINRTYDEVLQIGEIYGADVSD